MDTSGATLQCGKLLVASYNQDIAATPLTSNTNCRMVWAH